MTTPTRRARKLVAAFIREFGWDVSPARRTVEYWSPDAAIPQFHCRKAGRTPQLVAVVFKTEPWEYGMANQLRHGIGKDLWQGYHNAEQSAGLPVWLFVHEDKSGALLRARRSELVVAQELAAADSNGAYDEDMVFFARDEFDVLTTDAGETGQQHLVVEEVDSAFGEDDEPGGQPSLVGFGG